MPQKRAGEADGRKLTPGERAINWAKAGAIIIPLFGAGWFSNSDTAKSLIYSQETPPAQSSDPIEVSQPPEINLACPVCPEIDYQRIQCDLSGHIEELH